MGINDYTHCSHHIDDGSQFSAHAEFCGFQKKNLIRTNERIMRNKETQRNKNMFYCFDLGANAKRDILLSDIRLMNCEARSFGMTLTTHTNLLIRNKTKC